MYSLRSLLFILLLGIPAIQYGQNTLYDLTGENPTKNFIIERWSVEDGLPQNSVQAIVQDTNNYLWVATYGGLVRFDGVNFTKYDVASTPSFPSNRINQLFLTSSGSFILGFEGGNLVGFNPYDKSSKQIMSHSQHHILLVRDIAEDIDSTLWIVSDNGLFHYYPATDAYDYYSTNNGLITNALNCIEKHKNGYWYVGSYRGVMRFRTGGDFEPVFPNQLLQIEEIYSDPYGGLWFGGYYGLFHYHNGELRHISKEKQFPNALFDLIQRTTDGNLWLGKYRKGLLIKTGEEYFDFKHPNISRTDISAIHEDHEGNIWLGCHAEGLIVLKRRLFNYIDTTQGLSLNLIYPILQAQDGAIWIGTACGGLNRLTSDGIKVFQEKDGLTNHCVWSLLELPDHTIWIGTYGAGIFVLENEKITHFENASLNRSVVFSLYSDSREHIWIGSNKGLFCKNETGIQKVIINDELKNVVVKNSMEDDKGRLWFASDKGVICLHNDTFTLYDQTKGLKGKNYRSLFQDSKGGIWTGSYGSGMALIAGDTVYNITMNDGLFDNIVSTFLEDDAGNLWMTCNRGIYRVSLAELYEFIRGERKSIHSYSYGKYEGIPNLEFNGGCQPSSWRTTEGLFLFPSIGGVVIADPQKMHINKKPPEVFIEQVSIDNIPWGSNSTIIEAPAGYNEIKIEYTALSYQDPKNVQFRYMLEGLDKDWSSITSHRNILLKHIPPGNYTFRLIASNNTGIWNKKGTSCELSIAGFWYQDKRIQLLALLLIGLLIMWGFRMRISALKKRKSLLEKTVAERTRDLKEANETKDKFFSIIAHDLKSPFNSILGFSELLYEDYKRMDDGEREDYIGNINQSAHQVYDLLENLLAWARGKSGKMNFKPASIDIHQLACENLELLRTNASQKQISLACSVQTKTYAFADRNMINAVIRNLLSNAIKFTHPKGEVKIEAENKNDHTIIRVIDNGVGIPLDKIATLFHIDQQFRSNGTAEEKGTGLGLLLVKEFVEQNKGTLEVDSKPGMGSTFSVILPASSNE